MSEQSKKLSTYLKLKKEDPDKYAKAKAKNRAYMEAHLARQKKKYAEDGILKDKLSIESQSPSKNYYLSLKDLKETDPTKYEEEMAKRRAYNVAHRAKLEEEARLNNRPLLSYY